MCPRKDTPPGAGSPPGEDTDGGEKMAQASPGQISFNGGQIDELADARIDLTKYAAGCSEIEGALPLIEGPAHKMPGAEFGSYCIDSDNEVEVIPFVFNVSDSLFLEFGNGYIRPTLSDGTAIINTNEPSQAITSAAATAGLHVRISIADTSVMRTQDMVKITGSALTNYNDGIFPVTVLNATTFELTGFLPPSNIGPTAGGTVEFIYSLASPYTGSQVEELAPVQSEDVIYIAHSDVHPQKLSRLADDNWTIEDIEFAKPDELSLGGSVPTMLGGSWPPLRATNQENVALFVTNGSTVTVGGTAEIKAVDETGADADIFTAADVGRYLMLQGAVAERGYGKVTAFDPANAHLVDVEVYVEFPRNARGPYTSEVYGSGDRTGEWAFAAFDDEGGYPSAVVIHEQRAIWGGTSSEPSKFWATLSGGLENFREYGPEGVDALAITPGSAFSYVVSDGKQRNDIEWMASSDKLFVGTRAAEFTIEGGSAIDEPLTPANVYARNRSTVGGRVNTDPLRVGSFMLFVQRAGRKLYEVLFDDSVNTFIATDMNRLARSIAKGRIKRMAYQHEPNRVVWVVLETGEFLAFTYAREEEVFAWSKFYTYRPFTQEGFFESVAVAPGEYDESDVVAVVVNREDSGSSHKRIEVLSQWYNSDNQLSTQNFGDSAYVNQLETFGTGASWLTMTGLHSLGGEVAVAIRDNGHMNSATVANDGSVTFQDLGPDTDPGSTGPDWVTIVLADSYRSRIKTLRPEAGARDGTSQGKTGRVHRLVMRLWKTMGDVKYGPDFDNMDTLSLGVEEFTGDTDSLPFPDGFNQKREIAIEHDDPLPFVLTALWPQLRVEDRR